MTATTTFNKKSIQKMGGRKIALEMVHDLGEQGMDARIVRNLEKLVIEKSKKARKPPEKVKSKCLKVRVTEKQLTKLQAYADKKDVTLSQIICDYINRLPAIDD